MSIEREPIFDASPWVNPDVQPNLVDAPMGWGGVDGATVLGIGPLLPFAGRVVTFVFSSFGLVLAGSISASVSIASQAGGFVPILTNFDLTPGFSGFPTIVKVEVNVPFVADSGMVATLSTDAAFAGNTNPFAVQCQASLIYDRGISRDQELR